MACRGCGRNAGNRGITMRERSLVRSARQTGRSGLLGGPEILMQMMWREVNRGLYFRAAAVRVVGTAPMPSCI